MGGKCKGRGQRVGGRVQLLCVRVPCLSHCSQLKPLGHALFPAGDAPSGSGTSLGWAHPMSRVPDQCFPGATLWCCFLLRNPVQFAMFSALIRSLPPSPCPNTGQNASKARCNGVMPRHCGGFCADGGLRNGVPHALRYTRAKNKQKTSANSAPGKCFPLPRPPQRQ